MGSIPKEIKVDENTLKEIAKMLPKDNVEKTLPNNVVTKMMIEGRPDKLLSVLTTLLNTYIEKDSYGGISASKTKNYVMTFMLEEKPKII